LATLHFNILFFTKQDKKKGEYVMKKFISVFLAIGLVLAISAIAMAGTAPHTGIKQTSHDLSATGGASIGYGDSVEQTALYSDGSLKDRICIYCHAPHNTYPTNDPTYTYVPLWNHATTNSVFTMYSNGIDLPTQVMHQSQAMNLAVTPGSVSLLCLSCHDGTVATNEYGFAPQDPASRRNGAQKFILSTGRAYIGGGGDLSNHHPIGFDYAQVAADDPEIAPLGDPVAGTYTNGPKFISDLLWNGQVECTSCHDVHNTQNGGDKFTWVQDTNSALCLTCHKKAGGI
jgi:predicted CXXCH cytochrome family protein